MKKNNLPKQSQWQKLKNIKLAFQSLTQKLISITRLSFVITRQLISRGIKGISNKIGCFIESLQLGRIFRRLA